MNPKDKLLISLRIKGFGKPEAMAEALAVSPVECQALLVDLKGAGLAEDTKVGVRLTAAGKLTADGIRAAERAAADPAVIERAGEAFTRVNSAFKELVTRWQMREIDGKPVRNDHNDPVYDKMVLDAFEPIHADVGEIIENVSRAVPRFSDYARRLSSALARIRAGEVRYVAAPDAESYHTVWFELHQDLIGLLGTTRAKEAAAGRAV